MATNDLLVGYTRRFAAPVDATATFPTLSMLQAYASNDLTAYVGQICAVTGTNTVYVINNDKSVSAVGAGIPDAPDTLNQYARIQGAWVTISGGGGTSLFELNADGDIQPIA
jgi:hypothetical protein